MARLSLRPFQPFRAPVRRCCRSHGSRPFRGVAGAESLVGGSLSHGVAGREPSGFRAGSLLALALLTVAACAPPPTGDAAAADATVTPESWPEARQPLAPDAELEAAVAELLGRMSLEEKVGQVIQPDIQNVTPDDVHAFHLGSVLNGGGSHPGGERVTTAPDWLALADEFWQASMDTSGGGQAIPVLWGADAVHGHNNVIGATLFPHNIGLGAMHDPDLVRRIGWATGREVAVTGLDWDFGPTIAVVRDDRWGRTYESYSEDPDIVAAYAAAMVEGLQGTVGTSEWLDGEHVLATAKHFLGDGGTDGGRDQGDNLASEEELRRIHGAGYYAAIEAGVQTVMASFSSWRGVKMHGNRALLTDVLKGRMGFQGFLVGDWNAHGQVPGCSNSDCPASFNAGLDMFMVPEDWKALYRNTLAEVRSGEIPMERLDDAVSRILRVKMRAGLFDGPPSSRPLAGHQELMGAPEHREIARQAVRESLVLLKNQDGLLPLRPDQAVLVAGDGADDIGKQAGGWTISWQGTGNTNADFPGATSIWGGIRQAVEAAGGSAVLSADGSFDGSPPDVAIVVWGEDPYAEFQGDRETLEYQPGAKQDLALLRRLGEAGVPVVSVFLSGRPLWVNPELNASQAFVAAWLPGTEGGGVADVLFRSADGSVAYDTRGRLSFSWPRSPSQTPLNVGDPGYDPLFPYGYGLSYEDDGSLEPLDEEAAGGAGSSSTVYLADGPVAPWELYVGDAADWRIAATGGHVETRGEHPLAIEAVDRNLQEDARSLRWSGGRARVYLAADEAVDLARESNGEMALAFDLLMSEAPGGEVELGMGCGEDCGARVPLTGILTGLPLGEWSTVRVRLRCLAEAGAAMEHIDTPFLLEAEGPMALTLSNVRLVPQSDGEAVCP